MRGFWCARRSSNPTNARGKTDGDKAAAVTIAEEYRDERRDKDRKRKRQTERTRRREGEREKDSNVGLPLVSTEMSADRFRAVT